MNPRAQFEAFRNWWVYMVSTFGMNTILILFLVYWSQGFRQFGALAITFYYKETLGLSPSTTQYIRTAIAIAWFIKPLYGMLSDNLPIMSYHRKSYLLLSGILGMCAYLSLFFIEHAFFSCLALVFSEFSLAIADVIADALMVEESRKDPKGGSGNLQSFCWITLSIGGFVSAPLGGVTLDYVPPKYIMGSLFVSPLFLVLAANKLEENPSRNSISLENIGTRMKDLVTTCKDPEILKPILFVFFARACSPSFPELMVYFMKDQLNFTASFISLLTTVGFVALGIGSFCYNKYLKNWEFRKVLGWGQVLLALIGLFDIMLVTGFYELISIPPQVFALGGDTVTVMVQFTFNVMPLFVLYSKLCPEGCEATLFALFASVSNVSIAFSVMFGGLLTDWFGIETGQYRLIWVLMILKSVTKLFPLPLLTLLPQTQEQEVELEVLDEPFSSSDSILKT